MNYPFLLFDFDGTLLDFSKAEDKALKAAFARHGYPFSQQDQELFRRINKQLWHQYEQGTITRNQVTDSRFGRLFQAMGIAGDGVEFEREYQKLLAQGHDLIPGAELVLQRLQEKGHRLYGVTNGVAATQKRRMEDSGLNRFFLRVFVSEEVGFQKPDPRFFDFAAQNIPGFSREQALIVGDSLTSDIQGGNLSGIDTCWYQPSGEPPMGDILPTYTITSLMQLLPLLEG